MSLNFILLTHGWDILIPGTNCEACSFIGVYNQTHNRYKGLYAPAGRNGAGSGCENKIRHGAVMKLKANKEYDAFGKNCSF